MEKEPFVIGVELRRTCDRCGEILEGGLDHHEPDDNLMICPDCFDEITTLEIMEREKRGYPAERYCVYCQQEFEEDLQHHVWGDYICDECMEGIPGVYDKEFCVLCKRRFTCNLKYSNGQGSYFCDYCYNELKGKMLFQVYDEREGVFLWV